MPYDEADSYRLRPQLQSFATAIQRAMAEHMRKGISHQFASPKSALTQNVVEARRGRM
jgi:hypothetical protein